jgi:shikimate kinase
MSAPDSVPPDSIPAASPEASKAVPAQKQADAARLERTIALVGMMGAGKSTVGRKLADSLGAGFVDSDEEIEKAASLTVQEIFERLGEPEFRRGERRVIERLVNGPPIVLATGGGAYLDPTTRALLKEKATTVWLRADLETIWKRVSRRDTRPLLKKPNPKQVLADLAAAREPIYAEADIVIDSGDAPASDAVRKIREALGLTV